MLLLIARREENKARSQATREEKPLALCPRDRQCGPVIIARPGEIRQGANQQKAAGANALESVRR